MCLSSADCRSGDGGRFALDAPLLHLGSRRSPFSSGGAGGGEDTWSKWAPKCPSPGPISLRSLPLSLPPARPPPTVTHPFSLSLPCAAASRLPNEACFPFFPPPLSHCRTLAAVGTGAAERLSSTPPRSLRLPSPFPGHLCKRPHSLAHSLPPPLTHSASLSLSLQCSQRASNKLSDCAATAPSFHLAQSTLYGAYLSTLPPPDLEAERADVLQVSCAGLCRQHEINRRGSI